MKKRAIDKIHNSIGLLDVYVAPLFLLCMGIVFIVLSFTTSIPKAIDLSEVRGHLESYYFNQRGRGHDDYNTILILEEGSRFWTDALNKDSAKSILKERGSEKQSRAAKAAARVAAARLVDAEAFR